MIRPIGMASAGEQRGSRDENREEANGDKANRELAFAVSSVADSCRVNSVIVFRASRTVVFAGTSRKLEFTSHRG